MSSQDERLVVLASVDQIVSQLQAAKPPAPPASKYTFVCCYFHRVAARTNQLTLPKAFVSVLEQVKKETEEGNLYLIHHLDESFLRLCGRKHLEFVTRSIMGLDAPVRERHDLYAALSDSAHPVNVDDQSRVVIPDPWVTKLGLADVALRGVNHCIEIWPEDAFRDPSRRKPSPLADTSVVTDLLNS